jgi:hypothetical protein
VPTRPEPPPCTALDPDPEPNFTFEVPVTFCPVEDLYTAFDDAEAICVLYVEPKRTIVTEV